MRNILGVAIWIAMGIVVALPMKVFIERAEAIAGHTPILVATGIFSAAIGGMMGVGIFDLYHPYANSRAGMLGASTFSALMTGICRWGIRGLV